MSINLMVNIGANIKEFQSKMKQVSQEIKTAGKGMRDAGKTMTLGLSVPLAGIGVMALKSAADLETMETAFKTMTGSADEAKRIMKSLTEFTAKTPFQLEGVGQSAQQLMAFGVASDELIPTLTMLGDISAGAKVPLNELAAIFGKSKTKGKAMTEELLQMAERGIPVIQVLAKQFGVTEEAIFEMASKSQISFDAIVKAMQTMTTEGGVFAGGMEAQSQTLAGVFSTLSDNVSLALGELGNTIVETFNLKEVMANLIVSIQQAVEWFKQLSPAMQQTIVIMGAVGVAIGPVLYGLGALAKLLPILKVGFALLTSPVGLIVLGITALATAFAVAWNKSAKFRATLKGVWAASKQFGQNFVNMFREIPSLVWEAIKNIPKAFIDLFKDVGAIVSAIFTGEFEALPELLKQAGTNLLKTNPLFATGMKLGETFAEGMGDAFEDAYVEEMVKSIKVANKKIEDSVDPLELPPPTPPGGGTTTSDTTAGPTLSDLNELDESFIGPRTQGATQLLADKGPGVEPASGQLPMTREEFVKQQQQGRADIVGAFSGVGGATGTLLGGAAGGLPGMISAAVSLLTEHSAPFNRLLEIVNDRLLVMIESFDPLIEVFADMMESGDIVTMSFQMIAPIIQIVASLLKVLAPIISLFMKPMELGSAILIRFVDIIAELMDSGLEPLVDLIDRTLLPILEAFADVISMFVGNTNTLAEGQEQAMQEIADQLGVTVEELADMQSQMRTKGGAEQMTLGQQGPTVASPVTSSGTSSNVVVASASNEIRLKVEGTLRGDGEELLGVIKETVKNLGFTT